MTFNAAISHQIKKRHENLEVTELVCNFVPNTLVNLTKKYKSNYLGGFTVMKWFPSVGVQSDVIVNTRYINLKTILIMKQMKFFLVALLSLLVSNVALADDTPIPVESLPAAAKTFVQTNFQGKRITYAEKDRNSYECRLDDGTKMEFNRKGVWKKVDCHVTAVPAAIIPQPIQQYVTTSFPGTIITKIDKERYGYDIELSNEIDLKFNYQGVIIGMDD